MTLIKLSGYKYIEAIESAFQSRLVDIAYIDEVNDDYILVIPDDSSLNLSDENEFSWIRSIIQRVLEDTGEINVNIEIINISD